MTEFTPEAPTINIYICDKTSLQNSPVFLIHFGLGLTEISFKANISLDCDRWQLANGIAQNVHMGSQFPRVSLKGHSCPRPILNLSHIHFHRC